MLMPNADPSPKYPATVSGKVLERDRYVPDSCLFKCINVYSITGRPITGTIGLDILREQAQTAAYAARHDDCLHMRSSSKRQV